MRSTYVRLALTATVVVASTACEQKRSEVKIHLDPGSTGSGVVRVEGRTGACSPTVKGTMDEFERDLVCSWTLDHKYQTVTATPDAGSRFVSWTGDCQQRLDPGPPEECFFNLERDVEATVRFDRSTVSLTVTGAGTGDGTVTGGGIQCSVSAGAASGTCTASVAEGASVSLTATPASGFAFAGWGGACSGTAGCTVTGVQADVSVSASFEPVLRTLSVGGGGGGSGSVSGAGLSCTVDGGTTSGTCSTTLAQGTTVQLTATADAGSLFEGWSGACTGSGACSLTLDGDAAVTATFRTSNSLTVTASGTGSGTVTGNGLTCAAKAGATTGTCEVQLAAGTVIGLTATPDAGSGFEAWSGACTGTGTCAFTLDSDATVSAAFGPPQQTLDVDVTGSGSGRVTGGGIDCTRTNQTTSGACSIQAAVGTVVDLTLTPDEGSNFLGWGGDCSGTASTCQVTLSENRSVTAELEALFPIAIDGFATADYHSLRIQSGDGLIDCSYTTDGPGTWVTSGTCATEYPFFTTVVLTASAPDGKPSGATSYAWTGCSSTGGAENEVCEVFVDGPIGITLQLF